MSYTYLKDCGNCTSSLGLEEASSAVFSLDILPSALSKSSPTAEKFYSKGSETESCQGSPCGMTLELSRVGPGKEGSMLSAPESLVRRLAPPETEGALSTKSITGIFCESFAKRALESYFWKTPHCFALEGLDAFSGTWPRWGTMRAGECWELVTSEPSIGEIGYGFLPTPTATDHKSESMSCTLAKKKGGGGISAARITEAFHRQRMPTPNAVQGHCNGRLDEWGGSGNLFRGSDIGRLPLNPFFVEQMMNWPIGWTDLKPLETAKFRLWLRSHGEP